MSYVLCVSGSRDFDNYKLMRETLDEIIGYHGRPSAIMHGAAPGADALASRFAYERKIDVDPYGAKWGTFGNGAGPIRNKVMADLLLSGDVLVAFPTENSRGTWNMVGIVTALDRALVVIEES